jgi:hypothetical protein
MKKQAIMETINNANQAFEEDGTHLTKEAGTKYVQQIIILGKQIPINIPPKKQSNKDQTRSMEVDTKNTPTKKPWHGKESVEVEDIIRKLEEQVKNHAQNLKISNTAVSKIREELDADTNGKKWTWW